MGRVGDACQRILRAELDQGWQRTVVRMRMKRPMTVTFVIVVVAVVVAGAIYVLSDSLRIRVAWIASPGGSWHEGKWARASGYSISNTGRILLSESSPSPGLSFVEARQVYRVTGVFSPIWTEVALLIKYDEVGKICEVVATGSNIALATHSRTVIWAAMRTGQNDGVFVDCRNVGMSQIAAWDRFVQYRDENNDEWWQEYYFGNEGGQQIVWQFDEDGSFDGSFIRLLWRRADAGEIGLSVCDYDRYGRRASAVPGRVDQLGAAFPESNPDSGIAERLFVEVERETSISPIARWVMAQVLRRTAE